MKAVTVSLNGATDETDRGAYIVTGVRKILHESHFGGVWLWYEPERCSAEATGDTF